MKKQLNVEAIADEFSTQSSFFREARAAKEGGVKPEKKSTEKSNSDNDRAIKKMTLDLYMDQYLALTDIKTKMMREGKNKTLVDFVRDAIDEFIAKNS